MALPDTDIKEIKAAHDRMMECLFAFDWCGYADAYVDDAIFLPPGGEMFQARGKQSLVDWMAEQMRGVESLEVLDDVCEVDGDGDCACMYTLAKEKVTLSDSDDALEMSGKCVSVFEKQPDHSWKIKLEIWNK